MKIIKRDFMLRELHRLAVCTAGFAVCLFILFKYGIKSFPMQIMLLSAVAAVIVLAVIRTVIQLHISTYALNDNDIYLLEKEYSAKHPVCKVWQGEMHLMQSFIVCRSRGRLLFIPLHNVERAEERFDRIGMKRVPFVRFIMDTDKSVSVGFPLRYSNDNEKVFSWLTDRLGSEKVRR